MKKLLLISSLVFSFGFSQDIPLFDSNRAMNLLETLCAFGPRYPGSKGHDEMNHFLKYFFYLPEYFLYIPFFANNSSCLPNSTNFPSSRTII